jgi:copper(I)-binding protein
MLSILASGCYCDVAMQNISNRRSARAATARRRFAGLACLIALLAVVLSPSAIAQHHSGGGPAKTVGSLSVAEPWTRATPGGAKVGGGYLKITNSGREADRLTGASLPQAGRVEIHEMTTVDGVARMRPLDGLEIKPGQTVELKPGGLHLMFMDLSSGLKAGESIKGTLTFEKAGAVDVTFRVAPAGSQNSQPGAHGH